MCGENEQAGVVHADALGEDEVGGVICVEWALLGKPVVIVAGGFVAVMAIGDKEGLGIDDGGNVSNCLDVGDGPEAMDDAEVVGGGERSMPGDGFFEQILSGVFGI